MEIGEVFRDLPRLETDRLVLRKLVWSDLEDMHAYCSDEEVARYVTWHAHRSIEDTEAFLQFSLTRYDNGELAPWGIEEKESGRLIGTIDFVMWNKEGGNAEIGYALRRDCWGKGYVTEAGRAVVAFGFERMNLVRLQARCFTGNVGSARVMEKLGMTYEGTMRQAMLVKGEHVDVKVYSILKSELESGN